MITTVILDSSPLSLVADKVGKAESDRCRDWVIGCLERQMVILVPEIADYEVRRELTRLNNKNSIARLDTFNSAVPNRYIPLTTQSMRLAAQLWATIRQQGLPTAEPAALDGDVILAAQVLLLGSPAEEMVVATSNPSHISRFVAAQSWQDI